MLHQLNTLHAWVSLRTPPPGGSSTSSRPLSGLSKTPLLPKPPLTPGPFSLHNPTSTPPSPSPSRREEVSSSRPIQTHAMPPDQQQQPDLTSALEEPEIRNPPKPLPPPHHPPPPSHSIILPPSTPPRDPQPSPPRKKPHPPSHPSHPASARPNPIRRLLFFLPPSSFPQAGCICPEKGMVVV